VTPQGAAANRVLVKFERVREGHWIELSIPSDPERKSSLAPPLRVARLLAYAHLLEQRIASGEVASRAALARDLGVTRARMTQILDLTLLAPDIQEEILFTEAESGFQPVNERALRWVVRALDWPTQRARWCDLNSV